MGRNQKWYSYGFIENFKLIVSIAIITLRRREKVRER